MKTLYAIPGGKPRHLEVMADASEGLFQCWRQANPGAAWTREGQATSEAQAKAIAAKFHGYGKLKVLAIGESPTAAPKSTRTMLYT